MQTYTKIYHKRFPLWKKLNRKLSKDAKIIYMYLLSSPFTHHSGIFEYSETILVNTGLKMSEIEKGVSELLANGLITVDEQLEYCLITYLVENIKLDNKNMATSLVKYILDLEKTFLIGVFHQLIENTDIFNRIETVEEGLLNRYLTLSKPFANKDYTINTIDNTINTINYKLKNKDDKPKIKEDKEKNALLEKDAEDIYNYYRINIKGGSKKVTVTNLKKFLKDYTKDELIKSIDNYIYENKKNDTDIKYYKKPENFFSNASEVFAGYTGFDALREEKVKEFFKRMESIRDNVFASNEGKIKSLEDARDTYINFLTEEEIEKGRMIITGELKWKIMEKIK